MVQKDLRTPRYQRLGAQLTVFGLHQKFFWSILKHFLRNAGGMLLTSVTVSSRTVLLQHENSFRYFRTFFFFEEFGRY